MRSSAKLFTRSWLLAIFAAMFIFAASSAPAWGQVGGNLNGLVTDPSDASVPGATVTVTNNNNGASQKLTTGADGMYRAVNLQPAAYTVTVEAAGFATQKKTITLLVGTEETLNFKVGVTEVAQNVTVTGEAGAQIEVTKSEPSSVVNDEQIDDLPVLNRDFLVIAQTMPGSTTMTNMGVYPAFNVTKFGGVADQRSGNSTILDGAPIDDPIWGSPVINMSQDAIQEFKVYRDQFDAQYGYSMNAIVTVASKAAAINTTVAVTTSGGTKRWMRRMRWRRQNRLTTSGDMARPWADRCLLWETARTFSLVLRICTLARRS